MQVIPVTAVHRGFGTTSRRDTWWAAPLGVFLGLSAFIIYATWAAFQNAHYTFGPYLSPFYAPELWGDSPHAWFGPKPDWWPALLPHYRWVRVLRDDGGARLVEMAARRDVIPVWWQALQVLDPAAPSIRFRHVRGVTTGMEVEWRFEPVPGGVRVRILHDLALGWPLIGRFAAERVIGPGFVAHIAGQTLRRLKQVAEAADAERAPDAAGGAAPPAPAGTRRGERA